MSELSPITFANAAIGISIGAQPHSAKSSTQSTPAPEAILAQPDSRLATVGIGDVLTPAQKSVLLSLAEVLPDSFENAVINQQSQASPRAASVAYVHAGGRELGIVLPAGLIITTREVA